MIIQEFFEIDGRDFIRTYSDSGHYVLGGEPYGEYTEVVDPAEFNRTYIEGDLIPPEEEESSEAEELLNIILGEEI